MRLRFSWRFFYSTILPYKQFCKISKFSISTSHNTVVPLWSNYTKARQAIFSLKFITGTTRPKMSPTYSQLYFQKNALVPAPSIVSQIWLCPIFRPIGNLNVERRRNQKFFIRKFRLDAASRRSHSRFYLRSRFTWTVTREMVWSLLKSGSYYFIFLLFIIIHFALYFT